MIEKSSTTIKLDAPIKMGENEVVELTLIKPMAGQLRGIKLFELLQGDTAAYIELLPRISTPAINKAQASNLDLIDLMKILEVAGSWFVGKNENTQIA